LKEAKQENQRLDQQLQQLQERVEELERENEALEETKEGYEQRQFAMDALLKSVGRSFDQASDELADYGVTVGDLDVTLHADVSGGDHRDTLDLRLVDPDEEIDPERLSTISFSVGRRGRLRHHGHAGAQATRGGTDGPLTSGTPTTEEAESDEETIDTEAETPTDGPAEVPNVSGLEAEEATQELTEAGFEAHTEYRPDETPVGRVVEQWPRAFSVAPRGSSVVLFVGGEEGGS
jgi:TolA-binding protein